MTILEIVLISVVSVLVFSLIIGFIIYKYYKRFVANRLNDFLIFDKYKCDNDIVFLGDSLTDFFPLSEFIKNKSMCNRGIASETTFNILNRLDEVLQIKPKTVFLQIGINDLIYDKKTKANELVNRIMEIATRLNEVKAKVYIISLYPINRNKMFFSFVQCRFATNSKINEVNLLLEKRCQEKSFKFIDIHQKLLDENQNLKEEYTLEGLHLSALGYSVIYESIKEYL